jgi:hypothetical protein
MTSEGLGEMFDGDGGLSGGSCVRRPMSVDPHLYFSYIYQMGEREKTQNHCNCNSSLILQLFISK